jgi:hypothetical protein
MRARSLVRRLVGTAVVALAATAAAATTQATSGTAAAAQGNPVTDWNEIAQNAIVVGRPPGSSAVLEGILQAAIYDATVAIEGGYDQFVASPTVHRPASTAAAVAEAAHDVLVARVPGQATNVENQYDAYLATIPDGPAKENGRDVGDQVAEDILAWRAGDGFDNVIAYEQQSPGPGVFEPVPPEVMPPPTPLDVKLRQVRPLTLTSNSQFRPDGPSSLTSVEYAEDLNEVKAYGRVDSAVRTPAQTEVARFWSENSANQWPRTLRALAIEHGLGLAETARMLAMTQVAAADAILGCFDAKYHYLFWRPVHAIRRADSDGNPATQADPTWTPLLVVNHPEYPSAHACWSKAVTKALAAFFGHDKVAFSMDSLASGTTRSYPRFSAAVREVYDARVWAGLHFRGSMRDGAWIGRKVARYVERNFFRPRCRHST